MIEEKKLREELINSFNQHNKKIFNQKKSKSKKIFLIEFNGWAVIHIIYSYLVNYFKKEKNCKIVAYEAHDLMNRLDPPKLSKYNWKLGSFFNVRTFKIFRMFRDTAAPWRLQAFAFRCECSWIRTDIGQDSGSLMLLL